MDESEKIKVVWLCGFSNPEVNEYLSPSYGTIETFFRKAIGKSTSIPFRELSIWVTNAIKEFENFTDEIELHIISPYSYLSKSVVEYSRNGIEYHFFNNERYFLCNRLLRRLFNFCSHLNYKCNRRRIINLINEIKPDVAHLIGAEIPEYSSAILDIPKGIPVIVQLQTLLNQPDFEDNYFFSHKEYKSIAALEKLILQQDFYVGTCVKSFSEIIRQTINSKASIINTKLALSVPVNLSNQKKEFDFIYFAKEVEKAGDHAVEAFIRAAHNYPDITLDIVGACTASFKQQLQNRLSEAGVLDKVTFEGSLPSHDDVIKQIRKSRFAIIPIKMGWMTGTIRESMANGIPVCTSISTSTLKQNDKRESLLLSPKGDFDDMAKNMCRLLSDSQLADNLRENAAKTISEYDSNESRMRHWVFAYKSILSNKRDGTILPDSLIG